MRGMALTEEAKARIWRIMRENGVPLESQAKPSTTVLPDQPASVQVSHEQQAFEQPAFEQPAFEQPASTPNT